MNSFKIIPILGTKTNVPQDDPSLFRFVSQGLALTHDVGGTNFDLERKRNTCTKAYGKVSWDNSATAQATKCMGLFEIYDGTNRNHLFYDNGKIYAYDSALDPQDISAGITFANSAADFYSTIKLGEYAVFADWAEHTPYKWKHGDANVSKLIASGTEYQFRYLMNFQRRVIGLYSDQTNGNIEVRWSTDYPGTAITSLNYPALNQLYVPNDDTITGGKEMGSDRAYIYCDDSIQQLIYYPDYELPFRMITVVPKQGCTGNASIINVGDRHYFFNRNYGFCEYRGGQFPAGGRPISADIDTELWDINADFYNMIVGTVVPFTSQIAWLVPLGGDVFCDTLLYYNYLTGQWTKESRTERYIDSWRMYNAYTWNDFIEELGGTGALWSAAGTNTWGSYTSLRQRLAMAGTNGHLYYKAAETNDGGALDGYRIEPIMHFGDSNRYDMLNEIWFDMGQTGSFSIDVYHRSGDTVGEVAAAAWVLVGSVSCNSPTRPVLTGFSKSARLHQIKWGTNLGDERFEVNGITFKFISDSTA